MAAVDLSNPTYWPFPGRDASVGTTWRKFTLPSSHGPITVSVIASADVLIAFDPALTDGGTPSGVNIATGYAKGARTFDIPSPQRSGTTAVYVAAAVGTADVTVTVTRPQAL